jgi:hypothetical protein
VRAVDTGLMDSCFKNLLLHVTEPSAAVAVHTHLFVLATLVAPAVTLHALECDIFFLSLHGHEWSRTTSCVHNNINNSKPNTLSITTPPPPPKRYDSDEEIDEGGTWEHKKRAAEMKKTEEEARRLTEAAQAKKRAGLQGYIPDDVLEQFLEKVRLRIDIRCHRSLHKHCAHQSTIAFFV